MSRNSMMLLKADFEASSSDKIMACMLQWAIYINECSKSFATTGSLMSLHDFRDVYNLADEKSNYFQLCVLWKSMFFFFNFWWLFYHIGVISLCMNFHSPGDLRGTLYCPGVSPYIGLSSLHGSLFYGILYCKLHSLLFP